MASRRFFAGYDPYDYYYTSSPYNYPSPYYHLQQPAPARRASGFFQDADQYYGYQPEPAISGNAGGFFPSIGEFDPYYHPAPARRVFPAAGKVEPSAVRSSAGASRPVSSIPVRSGADPEPEEISRVPVKRAPSAEEAAVRVQAAARGFLARRAVRALRAVEREAEEIGEKVGREAAALRADARARVAVGEQLMRLLFRLDAVHGAREFRKRVARRVLALQDAVDTLEQRPVDAAEDAEASGTTTVETVAAGLDGAVEEDGEIDGSASVGEAADMEVDGNRVAAEHEEPAPGGTNLCAENEDAAEGEWEMLADEPAADESPAELAVAEGTTRRPAAAGGDLDAKKLMEMVAALCEQSAQQCAAIGALADRVDALERAVRRVEDAERRRQRAKKLKKEARRSNRRKCYSD